MGAHRLGGASSIQRRQLLGMIGGGALVAGCAGSPTRVNRPEPARSLDLSSASSRVRSFVKASSRLTPGRTIWATRAEVFAILPAGEVIPVVRVKGCEQQWIRPESHDSFISFDNLVSYYCDFDSDTVIREYKNPFTGADNTVRPNVSRMKEGREISPQGVVFRVMREAYPDFYKDLSFDIKIRQMGGNVSFQGEFKWPDEFIRSPAGSKITTFARATDLLDPALDSAPASFAGYVLMPFFPWMKMADHPGHLLWNVQGYKIGSLDALPSDYLAAAAQDFGDEFEQSPEFDPEPSGFAQRLRAMGRLP